MVFPVRDVGVDGVDRALVAALQLDGRAPWHSVARAVGASEATVKRRAARLEEAGLLRVIGVVDVLRCGLGVPVLMRVRCRPGRSADVAARIAERPQARFVCVVTGTADCVAEMVVPSPQDFVRVLVGDLRLLDGVLETETLAVMRTFISNHDWDPGVLDHAASDAAGLGGEALPFEERIWENPPERLDELERSIIDALGDSGRMSYAELARRVGASEATARRRVDSLIRRGCLRFRTLAEPSLLGFGTELMLWVGVDPARLDAAGQQLAAHPGTKYLSATTGRYNLVGQVVLRHYGELYRYTTDVVGALPGVRSADVTLQIDTLKRAWVPVPDRLRALSVNPPASEEES